MNVWKLSVASTVGIFLMMACGGQEQGSKLPPGASGSAGDKALLEQAQRFFTALPGVAEDANMHLSPEKIELGKVLYHDTRLSFNGTISCNSCHKVDGFGVDNEKTSPGHTQERGARNSPTAFNAALHNMQFWDGRAKTVEEQAGMPILNPVEHGVPDTVWLEKRLQGIAEYAPLFSAAFPGTKQPVTFAAATQAIGAFERTLLTPAPFDAFLKGDLGALSANAKAGLQLFMDVGCTTCHSGVSLGGTMLQKFGLHADFRALTGSSEDDRGLMDLTGKEADRDLFKVPGLRNVAKTHPYFHDGSVADLGKSVEIMAKVSLNKDLSPEQTTLIVAFLESLTGTLAAEAMEVPAILVKK